MRIVVLVMAIGMVVGVGLSYSDTITLRGSDMEDVVITAQTGAGSGDPSKTMLVLREYWRQDTSYDERMFMKIDLPTFPNQVIVNSATFGIWYIDAYGGSNSNHLDMGCTVDEFDVTNLTYETYDGTNAWTDGNAAGVDGYNRIHPHSLGSVQVNPSNPGHYVTIATSALADYIQTQINAGKDAYLEFSIDDGNGRYQRFYSADYSDVSKQPYLVIDYTVIPEPATISLLSFATIGLLRKR